MRLFGCDILAWISLLSFFFIKVMNTILLILIKSIFIPCGLLNGEMLVPVSCELVRPTDCPGYSGLELQYSCIWSMTRGSLHLECMCPKLWACKADWPSMIPWAWTSVLLYPKHDQGFPKSYP
jgi:hypothetical protein